jgi:ribosomal protein S18 acetylase RimI-like enzyme
VEPVIRLYRPDDRNDLYRICLMTGHHGEDATGEFADPMILGHVFAGPYPQFEPTLAFVVEDEEGVGGYILGALDTRAFEDRLESDWWPGLRDRYPAPGSDVPQQDWTPDQRIAQMIHDPFRTPDELVSPYPSHLHINLLQRLQSRGFGARLTKTLIKALRQQRSIGLHFHVWSDNHRALGFYRHAGFAEFPFDESFSTFVMDLRDS